MEKARSCNKKTVLVTGATGFLGEYIIKRLAPKYMVLALGRNKTKGKELEEKYKVKFCEGDFTDKESIDKYFYFYTIDYVIHAGALSTIWGKWQEFYKINVLGTQNIIDLCKEYGINRMVYISSPSIYSGKKDRFNIKECEAPKENTLNNYIRSKIKAEDIIKKEKDLEIVTLRPRGLIGVGDTSLIPRLLEANNKTGIPLFNNGKNLVDITSVENVALACELALTAPGAAGEVFNITNDEPMEFKQILEMFLKEVGIPPKYLKLPFGIMFRIACLLEIIYNRLNLKGEPPITKYTICTLAFAQTMDISKAKDILGYKPEKTLKESCEEYGRFIRSANALRSYKTHKKPGLIEQVSVYNCGYCKNNLGLVYKNIRGERTFPAKAFLIKHKENGYILFDTGYGKDILRNTPVLKIYRYLNPVLVSKNDIISKKLEKEGINPFNINKIIISHPHPDHIGDLKSFLNCKILSTKEVLNQIKKPKLRNLVFKSLLPKKIITEEISNKIDNSFLCNYFDNIYDIFGDGSILGITADGHSKGSLMLYIPDLNLLLAGDTCWGKDLVKHTKQTTFISKIIQNNYKEYKNTLKAIVKLKKDNPKIKVIFSHDIGSEREYVNKD